MEENHLFLYCFVPPYNSLSSYMKKFLIIIPHMTKQVYLRRRIYALVEQISEAHLLNILKLKISQVQQFIGSRFEDGLPCENKTRKGRTNELNKQQPQKLNNFTENTVGVSQRKLASKLNVSRSCIRQSFKKLGLIHATNKPAHQM